MKKHPLRFVTLAATIVGTLTVGFYVITWNRGAAPGNTYPAHSATPLAHPPTALNTTRSVGVSPKNVGDGGIDTALPASKVAEIARAVESTYGRALKGMNLAPRDSEAALRYLVEKLEAGHIAKQIASETAADLQQARREAHAQVDAEALPELGARLLSDLKMLEEARFYLISLNQTFSPALTAAGEPLNDRQIFPLVRLHLSTYGSIANPNAHPQLAGVDGVGLSILDYKFLEAANTVLTPHQLSTYRSTLASNNMRIVGVAR